MESFWILGAGHFGSLAVKRILERKKGCNLLVVDFDAEPLSHLQNKPLEIIRKDAIDFLLTHHGLGHEWIVPAIPKHVAYLWLCQQFNGEGKVTPVAVPSVVDQQVPNPIRGKGGVLYTSFATFRCPGECDEPEEMRCVTQERRETNLHELIQRIEVHGYKTLVVRSHQLTPGVGGYQLSTLWRLREAARSTEKDVIVATACRCHGVINALRFKGKAQSAKRRAYGKQ